MVSSPEKAFDFLSAVILFNGNAGDVWPLRLKIQELSSLKPLMISTLWDIAQNCPLFFSKQLSSFLMNVFSNETEMKLLGSSQKQKAFLLF